MTHTLGWVYERTGEILQLHGKIARYQTVFVLEVYIDANGSPRFVLALYRAFKHGDLDYTQRACVSGSRDRSDRSFPAPGRVLIANLLWSSISPALGLADGYDEMRGRTGEREHRRVTSNRVVILFAQSFVVLVAGSGQGLSSLGKSKRVQLWIEGDNCGI